MAEADQPTFNETFPRYRDRALVLLVMGHAARYATSDILYALKTIIRPPIPEEAAARETKLKARYDKLTYATGKLALRARLGDESLRVSFGSALVEQGRFDVVENHTKRLLARAARMDTEAPPFPDWLDQPTGVKSQNRC
jgi:hypothetical protein